MEILVPIQRIATRILEGWRLATVHHFKELVAKVKQSKWKISKRRIQTKWINLIFRIIDTILIQIHSALFADWIAADPPSQIGAVGTILRQIQAARSVIVEAGEAKVRLGCSEQFCTATVCIVLVAG